MAKISNVMATKIALDLVDASKSVRNLTTEVNASTKAWQAQEASLRSAGDYAGAAKARLDGLGSAIDAQKEKISALQEKQESMNSISQETAEEFLRLKERIEQLRAEQASLDDVTGRNKDKYESLGAEISQTSRTSSIRVRSNRLRPICAMVHRSTRLRPSWQAWKLSNSGLNNSSNCKTAVS